MANVGVFDVLGPIMIGPSSSHTAGAAKLGKIAHTIINKPIKEVSFLLHGSFKETYKGHGTDRALVAGILGMSPDDHNLKDSLSIASEKNIKVNFIPSDLGDVHPNTVKILAKDIDDKDWEILGSSIGGGLIKISEINGYGVRITGEYPTIITRHEDRPGTISEISKLLSENDINIAFMNLERSKKGEEAAMSIETDIQVPENIIEEIKNLPGMARVIVINL